MCVHYVPAFTWPILSVRAFMKWSFSVMPSLRKDFGSLVKLIITGAPLHAENRSEKWGWPGRGLWVSLSVLRCLVIHGDNVVDATRCGGFT